MDDTITPETLQEETQVQEPVQTPTPEVSAAPTQTIPMYKTERGFNVHVIQLARDAREDLDNVRLIEIPAPVKRHRIGRSEFEAPTLSEVGGGSKNNFCQVVAAKDGHPISVDDIHYINTDPARSNINHGTASVGIGNFFSIGWNMKADIVVLLYEIVKLSQYTHPAGSSQDKDDSSKPVAKLTCQLVGYEISNWKNQSTSIPSILLGLLTATHNRMRNDTDYPFYMDIFRMVRPIEEFNQIGIDATSGDFLEHNESDGQFMIDVMSELLDIRSAQYEVLPPVNAKRKVDNLRIVETLILDPNGQFIDITVTPIRTDFTQKTFRLRLTQQNFKDEWGKVLLERNLTLSHTSFDRLKVELENRREKLVIVQLTSLR